MRGKRGPTLHYIHCTPYQVNNNNARMAWETGKCQDSKMHVKWTTIMKAQLVKHQSREEEVDTTTCDPVCVLSLSMIYGIPMRPETLFTSQRQCCHLLRFSNGPTRSMETPNWRTVMCQRLARQCLKAEQSPVNGFLIAMIINSSMKPLKSSVWYKQNIKRLQEAILCFQFHCESGLRVRQLCECKVML